MNKDQHFKLKSYSSMGTKARSLSEAFTNDAFVLKDVSGYSGVDRIYFSDECCRGRKRFSLCHEIGHSVLLHIKEDEENEAEADFFASYLMAPPPLIIAQKCQNVYDIICTFDVSFEMASNAWKRYQQWLHHFSFMRQIKLADYECKILKQFGFEPDEILCEIKRILGRNMGHLKISVVPIATSAKNPCTPKEEKWQVLYPMDL